MEMEIRSDKLFMLVIFILMILDAITTYYVVHYRNIGFETNNFVVGLWDKFGYFYGEVIFFIIFLGIFYIFSVGLSSKNKSIRLLSIILCSFSLVMLVYAVMHNILFIAIHN